MFIIPNRRKHFRSPPGYMFQGENYGYSMGGYIGTHSNVIERYQFIASANGADVGDLTLARSICAGGRSSTHGYCACGFTGLGGSDSYSNIIERFQFTTSVNGADVGDATAKKQSYCGHSEEAYSYISGGLWDPATPVTINVIERYQHATAADGADVGDLTAADGDKAPHSSGTHGYTSGGYLSDYSNVIERFAFAASGNASDVGDLTVARYAPAGASSATHGYTLVGASSGGNTNIADRFEFAASANSSDIGDLTETKRTATGTSEEAYAYVSGGYTIALTNTIERVQYAASANGADVGDLTQTVRNAAGTQY